MRYLTLCLFLIGAFIIGCTAQKSLQPSVKLDESFSLAQQDSAYFSNRGTQFWMHVEKITDNRCPEDVNCITGGKTLVQLRLENSAEYASFCLGADCRKEELNSFLVEQNNESYTIVLEEVRPYPKTGTETVEKQAIFKIKQAAN